MSELKSSTGEMFMYGFIAAAIAGAFALAVMDGSDEEILPEPPVQEQHMQDVAPAIPADAAPLPSMLDF